MKEQLSIQIFYEKPTLVEFYNLEKATKEDKTFEVRAGIAYKENIIDLSNGNLINLSEWAEIWFSLDNEDPCPIYSFDNHWVNINAIYWWSQNCG
jgi:hypothetical protein